MLHLYGRMCLERSRAIQTANQASRNDDTINNNNNDTFAHGNKNAMPPIPLVYYNTIANGCRDSSSFSSKSSSSSADESICDQLTVMLQQENSGSYNCTDYVSFLSQSTHDKQEEKDWEYSNPNDLNPAADKPIPIDIECRIKMAQWCFQVIDFAKFKRSTVSIAMSYLDRFLSSHDTSAAAKRALLCRKSYQLACMTCLYMAIKMNEKNNNSSNRAAAGASSSCSDFFINGRIFSDLSRNAYDTKDIMNMEREVLNTLQWRLNGPTSLEFLRYLLQIVVLPLLHEHEEGNKTTVRKGETNSSLSLFNDNKNRIGRGHSSVTATLLNVVDLCGFQLDLAVGDYFLAVEQKQSTIAISALLNALEVYVSVTGDATNKTAKGKYKHDNFDFITRVKKELTLLTNIDVLYSIEIQESREKLQLLLTNSGVKYQAQKQQKEGRRHQHEHEHVLHFHRNGEDIGRSMKAISINATTATKIGGAKRIARNKTSSLSTADFQIASSPICVSRILRVGPRNAVAPPTATTTMASHTSTNRRKIIHRSSAFQDSFQRQPQKS